MATARLFKIQIRACPGHWRCMLLCPVLQQSSSLGSIDQLVAEADTLHVVQLYNYLA